MEEKWRPPGGQYIFEQRKRLGLTMAEAAERANTSSSYWSQIEGGETKLPGADLRRRVAAALGTTHLRLLVAYGEITAEEAGGTDPRAELHAQVDEALRPIMDQQQHVDVAIESLRRTVDLILALSSPADDAPAPSAADDELLPAPETSPATPQDQ